MLWQKIISINKSSKLEYVGGSYATQGPNNGAGYTVSLTGLTGGIGTSPIQGDIVIILNGWGYTADGNPGVLTTGYTELCDLYVNATSDANLSVSWKIMGPTPDTSVFVASSASTATAGNVTVVHVWRGINSVTPIDVATTTAITVTNIPPDSPSITPITNGCVILSCGLLAANSSTASTLSTPTGMSNGVTASINAPSHSPSAGIASYSGWLSGAYDPAAWSASAIPSGSSSAAATIVLRPD